MAYSRPFGQNPQGASPWSSGVPPGLQQQQQHPQAAAQQMFQQPMGAFDISGAWQAAGQQQAGQWAPHMQPMQPPHVQFVPNPAFMQNRIQNMPPQQQPPQHMQRPMHQRSLSAPRSGTNGFNNKRGNQNSSFGGGAGGGNGGQRQQNNNNQQQQQQQQQQRATRQQMRQNNQKFNNNNTNGNANNNNIKQQQQQQQNQQQRQQQPQQQQTQQQNRGQTVKLTRSAKKALLRAKLAGGAVVETPTANEAANDAKNASSPSTSAANAAATGDSAKQPADGSKPPQSKTAERKQLKLQARKAAESLRLSKMPVIKCTVPPTGGVAKFNDVDDPPIEQAQLKCVPAVFGFVCKCCEVFLRDRVSRREHIESAEHIEKFKLMQLAQNDANKDDAQNDANKDAAQNDADKDASEDSSTAAATDKTDADNKDETKTSSDVDATSAV